MSRKILGIDVDLTVVDSLTPWVEWYDKLTGHDISEEMKKLDYGIEELMHMHSSPLDFWRKPDLYDSLEPFKDAKINIDILSEHFDIVFFSSCFPEHTQSKEFFIQRNFPYRKGFIATSNKGFVRCDYYVDDYGKYLKQVKEGNPNCTTYQIATDLNQDKLTYTWEQIKDEIFIKENLS